MDQGRESDMGLSSYRDQRRAVSLLRDAISHDHVSHAYIIEGERATDKRGLALAFFEALLCREAPGEGCGYCRTCRKIQDGNYEDLYQVAGDEKTGHLKDSQLAALQDQLMHRPTGEGGRNLALIEDADTMTMQAANRLLKGLEEPLPGTVLLLLSENTANLLATIRSRAITIRLVAGSERKEYSAEDRSMEAVAIQLLEAAWEGTCFYRLSDLFDSKVAGRKEALLFLDACERVLRDKLVAPYGLKTGGEGKSQKEADHLASDAEGAKRGGQSVPKPETLVRSLSLTEEARRDIRYHMNYKYAAKNMLLKMGRS